MSIKPEISELNKTNEYIGSKDRSSMTEHERFDYLVWLWMHTRIESYITFYMLVDGNNNKTYLWKNEDNSKWYDCECIDGVDDYTDLKWCKSKNELKIQEVSTVDLGKWWYDTRIIKK